MRSSFQWICPVLVPELCYQLDVGTVVEASAVSKLVAYMAHEPDVAAAASRILTSTPEGAASTLSVWQYMDFVMQKAVTWPTEVASGYLSVIPGQFCVFRWSAVSAPSSARRRRATARHLSARSQRGRSARAGHVSCRGPRVRQRDRARRATNPGASGTAPTAEATTDACDTFGELLRQRRRWQNSALAVRLWLWGRLPAYLSRSDKSVFDKARFTTSMLWQGLLTASEVMSPGIRRAAAPRRGRRSDPSRKTRQMAAVVGGMVVATGGLAWLTVREPDFTLAILAMPGAGRGSDAVGRFSPWTCPLFESVQSGRPADCSGHSHGPGDRRLHAWTALGRPAPPAALPSDGPTDQLRPLWLRARQRAQCHLGHQGPDRRRWRPGRREAAHAATAQHRGGFDCRRRCRAHCDRTRIVPASSSSPRARSSRPSPSSFLSWRALRRRRGRPLRCDLSRR